jgi:glycosyltransferase involved in cell wall biosynthesis
MGYRVLLCSGYVPFSYGGAERMLESLAQQLRDRGHRVATVMLPFAWYSAESVMRSYVAWRTIDVAQVELGPADAVITLKFPAHVVEHRNKTVWLIQQFRQVYDLFGTPYSPYDPTSNESVELRNSVRRMDTRTLGEAQRLFAISRNVARRLSDYCGLSARVLYPPPPLDGRFRSAGYGDYVFTLSRLDKMKRVEHLIHAMSLTSTAVRCRIAGDGPEAEALQDLARRLRVADRVEFLGPVSDADAIELYAGALAVYYAPYDEDYGLVTVEAMKSARPVLTFADSGGVLEFVKDRITGFVAPAGDAKVLAHAIDSLHADKRQAERIGRLGMESVANLTWDAAIRALLEG